MAYDKRYDRSTYPYRPAERRADDTATLIFFEPLDRDNVAASIETYSTANGRRSAFSLYNKRANGTSGYTVWERAERIANLEPLKALDMMNDFRDGKVTKNDEL